MNGWSGGTATMSDTGASVASIRERVRNAFQRLGVSQGDSIGETVLIRDGNYVGR